MVEKKEYRVKDIKPDALICLLLEIEDVHFNLNSVVFIPPAKGEEDNGTTSKIEFSNSSLKNTLEKFHPNLAKKWYQSSYSPESESYEEGSKQFTDLQTIANVYSMQEKYPNNKLLIVGHTDTTGSESSNQILSEERAKSVYFILTGDSDQWIQTIQKYNKVEDYQSILTHISERYDWDCHPGSIDNNYGSKTENAVKHFQERYNSEYNASLSVDGKVGPDTWKAIFNVYMKELSELLGGVEKLQKARGKLSFVDETQPTLGCGERYPIEETYRDNYRSQKNRRVELLFFKAGKEPDIQEVEDIIYKKKIYELKYLTPEPIAVLVTEEEIEAIEISFEDIEELPELEDDLESDDYVLEIEIADEAEFEDEGDFLLAYDASSPEEEIEIDDKLPV